jgi:hypothetical protein
MARLEREFVGIAEAVADMGVETADGLELMLMAVGEKTVAYLRSLTSEQRPPVKRSGPVRSAHPGHWGDVTGQLANSYGYYVYRSPGELQLVLYNTAEYAIFLEQHEGFFVLSGVTESGGPVEMAIRHAVAAIAPDWRVVIG